MQFSIETVPYRLTRPFRISRGELTHIRAVRVTLRSGGAVGRGEAVGVTYAGETPETMRLQLEQVRERVERGLDRRAAQALLPSGGARNALDCALWDLESKLADRRAWALADVAEPQSIPLTATLSLNAPDAMAKAARAVPPRCALKVKLGDASDDIARMNAVRLASPHARLLVDANGGWSFDQLVTLTPELLRLGVEMIEQPLPRGADEVLEAWSSPIPLCADESCNDRDDLPTIARRYAMLNIKLDKSGGLTEALATAHAARALGLPYMVGCMLESSLGLAPATLLAPGAVWCDLDGPTFLQEDRHPALRYRDGQLEPPTSELWG